MFGDDQIIQITISGNPHIGSTSFQEIWSFLNYAATTNRDYITARMKYKSLLRALVNESAKFQADTDGRRFELGFNENSPFIRVTPTILYISLHFLLSLTVFGILHSIFRAIFIHGECAKGSNQIDKDEPFMFAYDKEISIFYGPKKYGNFSHAYYMEHARILEYHGKGDGKYNEFYYSTKDFLIEPLEDFDGLFSKTKFPNRGDVEQRLGEDDYGGDYAVHWTQLRHPIYRNNLIFTHAVYAENVDFFIKAYRKRIAGEKKIRETREKENNQTTKIKYEILEKNIVKEAKNSIRNILGKKNKKL